MKYNKITGKGKPSNERKQRHHQKGGEKMTEEQIKKLLELLKEAIESEMVERFTINIKPNKKKKNKQA